MLKAYLMDRIQNKDIRRTKINNLAQNIGNLNW